MNSFRTSNLHKPVKEEHLRVHIGKHKGSISGTFNILTYIDKDTKQWVFYAPSFDISGYGESREKADEMLNFNIQEFFKYLKNLGAEKAQQELALLGWKCGFFKKQFSKVYVDDEGQLKGLNAENDLIEKHSLTAA